MSTAPASCPSWAPSSTSWPRPSTSVERSSPTSPGRDALTERAVFLIGGGWRSEADDVILRPFVERATGPVACLVHFPAEEDADDDESEAYAQRFVTRLRSAGAEVDLLRLTDRAPSPLAGAGGVFVAGGLTPAYQQLLSPASGWLPPAIPYCGFSAGAAVASVDAVVGGWRLGDLDVCQADAGEDLDELTVRPGLGLVDFSVEVHATQWGTLSRAVHAVRSGLTSEVWAVDEDTMVAVTDDGEPVVSGVGSVYRITPGAVEVLPGPP